MSSEDLVAYLKERLADEEQLALAATPGPWTREWAFSTHFVVPHDAPTVAAGNVSRLKSSQRADAEHIAAWDPARVLADIETKRKIIDKYGLAAVAVAAGDALRLDPHYEPDHIEVGRQARGRAVLSALDGVLRVLAQPYASRSDFNQEWITSG